MRESEGIYVGLEKGKVARERMMVPAVNYTSFKIRYGAKSDAVFAKMQKGVLK
jgi:hypothetical protein